MQKLSFHKKTKPVQTNQIAFKGGFYSLLMTGIVLAILIVVNIFASVLPKTLTRYDISSTKL